MYAPAVIERRLKVAEQKLGFEPQYHSFAEIQSANDNLKALLHPETGDYVREPNADEIKWIRNERTLCALDYGYWCRNYAYIKDWESRLTVFQPNVAQQIVMQIRAEMEEHGRSIQTQDLKARQLGRSTEAELAIAHRTQFYPMVNSVVASSDPDKSATMAQMMELCWKYQPWWLMPTTTKYKSGALIEFGEQNSGVSIQHGTQFSGIARGTTVTAAHLSELCDYDNPEELVEASLMKAMHSSIWLFLILEATAAGRGNWWHNTWKFNKENWPNCRLRPVFLPWFVGTDIYPSKTWIQSEHPIPVGWHPQDITIKHADRAGAYVRSNDVLSKYLGKNWKMPLDQMWFWEFTRREAQAKKTLAKFYQEMPADDEECVVGNTLVSTDAGIMRIDAAAESASVESGAVTRWIARGARPVVDVITQNNRQIRCTPEHLICLSDGTWKEAGALVVGDEIRLEPPVFTERQYVATWEWTPSCEVNLPVSKEWARFLGFFIGDGCWAGNNSVEIACTKKDVDVVADVTCLIKAIIGNAPLVDGDGGLTRARSSSVRWFDILWNLGCLDHVYSKSQKRNSGYRKRLRVPDAILRSPKSIVREFLRGLFEADGHAAAHSPQVKFFSKSDDLMRDVQLLLLGFGINSVVRESRKVNGDGRVFMGREMWLNAEAADLFFKEIGFVGSRKNSGKRVLSQRGAPRQQNSMVDRIVSVVPAGVEAVYDLTVEPAHYFGANGIRVHNCFQSASISCFDAEIISYHRENVKPPLGVFGIIGRDIPVRLQPSSRDILTDAPPIDVTCNWNKNAEPSEFRFLPLRFNGTSGMNEMGKLFVWEFPEDEEEYGMGVDTAEGVGLDRSVIEMVRKGNLYRNDAQVAEFVAANIGAHDLWPFALAIGTYYSRLLRGMRRQAKAVIECGKGGGQATQLELRKRGWSNLHHMIRPGGKKMSLSEDHRIGWYMNEWSRPLMLEWFIKALVDGWLEVNSPWLISEMESLERDQNKQKLKAAYGEFDDRIVALGIPFVSLHLMEMLGGGKLTMQTRQDRRNPGEYARYSPGLQASSDPGDFLKRQVVDDSYIDIRSRKTLPWQQ